MLALNPKSLWGSPTGPQVMLTVAGHGAGSCQMCPDEDARCGWRWTEQAAEDTLQAAAPRSTSPAPKRIRTLFFSPSLLAQPPKAALMRHRCCLCQHQPLARALSAERGRGEEPAPQKEPEVSAQLLRTTNLFSISLNPGIRKIDLNVVF